ncbi:fumarylacetoacetate hydrolase family protein [Bradyrhizobium sp. Leo121]|uniref:fumarylacetoacetate hydrolase family protein n=1 Tax=Bradyrhizobium sp. Leo121 TaxID=1571195 RepID=UPI00102A711D|nr:fumarylacetoacetate hydrolase family protein [Bradyrhizobium sp. Leo121]RZN31439.1 5-carboxymethyl-2-hydroxymuconate isomerase [Bradyrhizobium sp. Leo121]
MKLMSFRNKKGGSTYGVVDGDRVIDLGAAFRDLPDLKSFLGSNKFANREVPRGAPVYLLSEATYLPVIQHPGKIICVGLNYREHVQETGRTDSEYPALFLRTSVSQIAHKQALIKPKQSDQFDYEGELALVIGKPGRHIAHQSALDHVAGYACYNDGSVRDWQRHTHQWTPGKNFDGTGGFGPWMVTPDEIGERSATFLVTRVNDLEVQRASLAQMIFSIEDLITYISGFTQLEVGDVIVTGTPGGVGDRRNPKLYLKPGDRVTVEIDGIGLLENSVVAEA